MATLKGFTKYRTLPFKQHYSWLNYKYKRSNKTSFHQYEKGNTLKAPITLEILLDLRK